MSIKRIGQSKSDKCPHWTKDQNLFFKEDFNLKDNSKSLTHMNVI